MTSSATSDPPSTADAGWRDLLARPHLAVVSVLAGGIGLYAMNLYFTAALMPSVVADVGGREYYAWASTAYLTTAVVATMLVSRLLAGSGPRRAYVLAYVVFGAGTALCAAAPGMELFLAGRAVQGLGAGLLTGLGFAVIRSVLPARLWTRAAGVVSAMFGVGALVGPGVGGAFAEAGAWRAACAVLTGCAVLLAAVTLRALPAATAGAWGVSRPPVPLPSIVALSATAALLSVSATVSGALVAVTIGLGLVLLAGFLVLDRRDPHGVLPRDTYIRGNGLKWVYLTVAALCAGVMTENFIPLFGQDLAGLSPLLAGFLGAVLSLGWVPAQLYSATLPPHRRRAMVRIAPWLLTGGLVAYGVLQTADAGPGTVAAWVVALLVAGVGIGLAFPHLTVAAMGATGDPGEGAKAAAAVSTTQLIAFTLTSAVAGNLLTLGDDLLASARWLVLGIAVLTLLGVLTARRVRVGAQDMA